MTLVCKLLFPCALILSFTARTAASNPEFPCQAVAASFRTSLTFGKIASDSSMSHDISLQMSRCLGIFECQVSNVHISACDMLVPSSISLRTGPALEASVGFQDSGCTIVRNCSDVLVDQEVYDTVTAQGCMPVEQEDGTAAVVCAGVVVPQATLKAIWCKQCHSTEACHTCETTDDCKPVNNCDGQHKRRRHLLQATGYECQKVVMNINAVTSEETQRLRSRLQNNGSLDDIQQCLSSIGVVTAVGPTAAQEMLTP
eukprot:jgi/Botrbrau1/6165/Bobra.0344s0006.1